MPDDERLIAINGENPDPNQQTAACEFCLVCQFALFGHISAPNASELDSAFTPARIIWTGLSHVEAANSSDLAARPVRAPPLSL